jgi:hypothetical protein
MNKNILAIVLGLSLILAAWIIGGAYSYKFRQTETISVTGAADTNFVSDLIILL